MTREFLENLGLEKEVIDQIMKEHGKAIQSAKPQDYDDLKEANEKLKKQLGELEGTIEEYKGYKDQLAEKDSIIKDYELKNLKYRIAVEAGIPLELAGRLSGESEQDIKKDAETLASYFSQKQPLPLKYTEPKNDDDPYKKLLSGLEGE
jgi:predicted metal-binding transcription factor (methanogenesis marker protein 9)